MMAECYQPRQSYLAFARFSDKDEEAFNRNCLGRGLLGRYGVQGSFPQRKRQIRRQQTKFVRDLNRKFGSKREQGSSSSSANSAALFTREAPECRRHIDGLDTSNTRIVIPVLIVQDSFVSSELTASYLADVFGALLNRERIDHKVVCTFPLVLDVSDLEALRPFLAVGEISFGDCLRDRACLGSGVLPFRDSVSFIALPETFGGFQTTTPCVALQRLWTGYPYASSKSHWKQLR